MRRWILVTVLVPLATWGLAKLADHLARRRGSESPATRLLRVPSELRAHRRGRGRRRVLART